MVLREKKIFAQVTVKSHNGEPSELKCIHLGCFENQRKPNKTDF